MKKNVELLKKNGFVEDGSFDFEKCYCKVKDGIEYGIILSKKEIKSLIDDDYDIENIENYNKDKSIVVYNGCYDEYILFNSIEECIEYIG